MLTMRAVKTVLCALYCVLFVSGVCHAQMTQNLILDAKALALGNAVTADTPGIMSIHYNPAGLTKLKGRQFEVGIMNIYMDIDADFIAPEGYEIFGIDGLEKDPVANAHSHVNRLALYIPGFGLHKLPPYIPGAVPHNGFSYNPPGSKITFGNALFIPMAAGFYRDSSDPGRYQPQAAGLERITYLSPSFGYEINDKWSVGAGIHFSYFALSAEQWMRAPNMLLGVAEILQDAFNCESGNEPLAPWVTLCGGNIGPWDDIGAMELELEEKLSPSYTLGVTWTPNDWFSWGASYASDADMNLKGSFLLEYTEDFYGFWQRFNSSVVGAITAAILQLPSGVPTESGNVSARLTYPQHFQTGVSIKVHPKLTFNADLGWTDFKKWDAFRFKFDRQLEFLGAARILSPKNATSDSLNLQQGMVDIWNWGFGLEFHATSRLDLRAGVELRDSVIPDNQFSIMAPFGSAKLYSIGLGYQWSKKAVVDMNISYLQSIHFTPADGSCNLNCDNITNIVYNPYAGLDVKTSLRVVMAGINFRTRF